GPALPPGPGAGPGSRRGRRGGRALRIPRRGPAGPPSPGAGRPGQRYFWAASFFAASFISRTTWYFASSAETKPPPRNAPALAKASGFLAFMATSDSWIADRSEAGRSLRTTTGSFGMSFDTQITRMAPRATLPSRVSCWRSGRLVEATSTFLLAMARIDASCDPENVTFEK